MNKRIRELAEQAGIDMWINGNDEVELPENQKKFAELIVRECCNKIERKYKYALGEKTQWAMSQDVQDLLKEHFGVEE